MFENFGAYFVNTKLLYPFFFVYICSSSDVFFNLEVDCYRVGIQEKPRNMKYIIC